MRYSDPTTSLSARLNRFRTAAVARIASPYPSDQDLLVRWRANLLFSIIAAGLVFGTPALAAGIAVALKQEAWGLILFDISTYAVAFFLLVSKRLRYEMRALTALFMCYAVGTAVLLSVGPLSGGTIWLFSFAVLVGVLLGGKQAAAAILLNALTLSAITWAIATGKLGADFPFFPSTQAMVATVVNFIFLNSIVAFSVTTLVKGLVSTYEMEKTLGEQLSQERTQLLKAKAHLESEVRDRTQAEKALGESEHRYRRFIDNAPMAMFTVNRNGELTYSNKKLLAITGHRLEDWLDRPFHPLIFPDDLPLVMEKFEKRVRGEGDPEPYHIRVRHASGEWLWVEIISETIFEKDASGAPEITGIQSFLTDITERKHAEAVLKASEEKFRNVVDASPMGIHLYEIQGDNRLILTGANKSADRLLGINHEPLFGKSIEEAFPGLDRTEVPQRYRDAATDGTTWRTEQIDYDEGSIRGAFEVSAFQTEPGKMAALFNNITARLQALAALQTSEERFRTVVEESPLGISLIDADGRYKYINPQFEAMFGYTLADLPTGADWFKKAFPSETYRREVRNTWKNDAEKAGVGQARPRVYTVSCRDGSTKEINFRPVTMGNGDQLVIYEDVSERSKIQQQLQQAQKFEAIGTLAGGIAHDFNNLLMGIQGRASLITVDQTPSHAIAEHTRAIEEYVKSATDLTKQLLGIARGGKYDVKPVDLNGLVQSSSEMFGRTKKEIRIRTKYQRTPPVAEVDRSQIEQVLLNLYINAWQAMPDGGDLYLETQRVELDAGYCRTRQIEPGQYAKISVTDTGIGMPKSIQARIFDPFFTTKEKGRGTGLGLASAYGIINNHGGFISVYSEMDRGTTFNIYLPLSRREAHHEVSSSAQLIKGQETILLVDDEEMILEVGQAMLEKLGYRVITAQGGAQALETIAKLPHEIDLVILDLIMPGLDGGKTFDRIREADRLLPVILSSGYAINGLATDILAKGCSAFIQKPFNISALSQIVRKVLDSGAENPNR